MRAFALLLVGLVLVPPGAAQDGGNVLVFSRTTGFRHGSIEAGVTAVQALGATHGFDVTATEDPTVFAAATLDAYDAVVFLNTTGDVLGPSQQAAFEGYIQGGGGYVGVHAAADTEYDWPWYGGLVGAYFESHPPGTPTATVKVVDPAHPATAGLPASWGRTDEWYNYRTNPRGQAHVLATLDELTYSGGSMRGDHPIAWCQPYEGGRSFYTGGGHTSESFSEPLFLDHLWGGLGWAAGWLPGDCSATIETSWERSVLDGDVRDPMELAVAPDGTVFYVERGGAVKRWAPAGGGQTTLLATLPVTTSFEDGLLGITLDPDYASNGWIYLYYSPSTASIQRVSRFTVVGDGLDLSSEAVLLTVATNRTQGGHSGGSLAFGPDGTLYIATGDDTDPFDSDGYTPIDERPGRSSWDAQSTSGNPFDLRGKILRIRPLPDGTAVIPDGNLFPSDGTGGLPEIYAMGLRNPFRISLDPATGWLYWGEVGPDANGNSSARGPRGYDEVNQARSAGNYGWPYCTADNLAYRDYDFATGTSGPAFDCAALVNDSPNVAQAPVALPPARGAWAWYPYASSPEFPDIPDGAGRTVMAGPVVRAGTAAGGALPAYFDGSVFVYEWSRNWIIETKLDADGQPLAFQRFLPSLELNRPIDIELGPDGALYMVEWGAGYGGNNPEAALSRIAFVSGTRAPVVAAQASVTSGPSPLSVSFTSTGTFHPESLTLAYAWDLDGDGTTDATTPDTDWLYTTNGVYAARLTVTDANERSASTTLTIVVGNSEPVVGVARPLDGSFYAWGDSLRYDVSVVDPEDGSTAAGTIDCAAVVVQPGVGHDDHNHPLEQYPGCTGVFESPAGHGADAENVFLVVDASYTDGGADGAGALTARKQVIVRPKRLEAEFFSDMSGVQLEDTGDVAGGQNLGFIEDGDWIAFDPVSLDGIDFLSFRVASAGAGGTVEVRADALDGPLLATARVTPTGNWQSYKDVTVPVTDPGGSRTLYVLFRNPSSGGGLFNLNWIQAHGVGAAVAPETPAGLIAEYFPEPDLTGDPVTRIEPQVSFDWGTAAPIEGVPPSGFSARWRGVLRVPASGTYRFSIRADDGVRLFLNEEALIDDWDGAGTRTRTVSLEQGAATLRMEYRDQSREAEAALLWARPGQPLVTLSEEFLTADPSAPTAAETGGAAAFELFAPRPNPVRGAVDVSFALSQAGPATVEVFDALGRRVLSLLDGPMTAGAHAVRAAVSDLPSGVYVVRLSTEQGVRTRLLTVVR